MTSSQKNFLKTIRVSRNFLRISPRKLNLVARSVNQIKPEEALKQMQFCNKKAATFVADIIKSAVASAENTHNMRLKDLVISSISVGKAKCMKRFRPRAKGRAAPIRKFFSNLYLSMSVLDSVGKSENT